MTVNFVDISVEYFKCHYHFLVSPNHESFRYGKPYASTQVMRFGGATRLISSYKVSVLVVKSWA